MEDNKPNLDQDDIQPKSSLWGKIRLVATGVLLLLLGIFLAMNFVSVTVWFFGFNFNMPLIVLASLCFFVGALCGWIGEIMYRKRLDDE
ncbi:MAG: LapA family protein [Candidatus Hinthialibacter antarcticus]|nr:LapA family protein [Candidatus Hinthialibacter antarcticus]